MELLKQAGETLAGRIEFVSLHPLDVLEVAADGEARDSLQGGLLNADTLARSLLISAPSVTRYIDTLAGLFLVRRLPPFAATWASGSSSRPRSMSATAGWCTRFSGCDGVARKPRTIHLRVGH